MPTCFWCNCDLEKKMANNISQHSTWCPHYRSPPSAKKEIERIKKLMNRKGAQIMTNHSSPANARGKHQAPRPDLSTVEKRNAFYSSEQYRAMTTAEKCAVQGDGFLNDYD